MKIFISYKWEDPDHNIWVERLASDLRARGIEALLDKWEVRYGESFSDYMTRGIENADAVLFIMTPRSVGAAEAAASGGGAVKFEVQLATARRLAGEAFRFIGILRRGDRPAAHLRDFRYADFRDDHSYETSLRHLVADLRGRTERPPVVSESSHEMRMAEWTSVGEELGTPSLQGEFILGTRDLVVWEALTDGPASPIGLFRRQAQTYSYTPVESISLCYKDTFRARSVGNCYTGATRRSRDRSHQRQTVQIPADRGSRGSNHQVRSSAPPITSRSHRD